MTKTEFDALPVEERLEFVERAFGRTLGEIDRKIGAAAGRAKTMRKDAAAAYRDGDLTDALRYDAAAGAHEKVEAELGDLRWQIRCWMAHSSTPEDELPLQARPD